MPAQRRIGYAVTVVAGALLVGCAHHPAPTLPDEVLSTSAAPASAVPADAPLPTPDALADVLYRLADPALPSGDKVDLVEGATPDESRKLDRFTAALKDGGYLPLTFDVADVGLSDRNPGNATATVKVTTHNPDTGDFTFPMEFSPHDGGWRLSQQTAGLLLSFGAARSGDTPTPTSTP